MKKVLAITALLALGAPATRADEGGTEEVPAAYPLASSRKSKAR